MSETESGFNPEAEARERTVEALLELVGGMGFEISAETRAILREINSENISQVITAWRPGAESFANQAEGEYWHVRQLGLQVLEAALILKAGLMEDFWEAAEGVEDYALGVRLGNAAQDFKKIAQTIKA